jgi:hypothetical protein
VFHHRRTIRQFGLPRQSGRLLMSVGITPGYSVHARSEANGARPLQCAIGQRMHRTGWRAEESRRPCPQGSRDSPSGSPGVARGSPGAVRAGS